MAKKAVAESRRLNPEQQLVADHLRGPLRVGAVAGSGKTHALIERTATLVEGHRVTPSKILLISFSVNARKEMEKRLVARLPGVAAGEICRTFHSIGLDIFREETDRDKLWLVDTTGRLWRKSIRLAAKKVGINLDAKHSELTVRAVEKVSSLAKTRMLLSDRALRRLGRIEPELKRAAEDVVGPDLADDALGIMHAAEDIREVSGIEEQGMFQRFVTFDDMLYASATLLRSQDVRKRWAHRWTYVMQDEVQDENPVQGEIAEALCSVHRNYMVVGDPAQAIYGFRAADPKRMLLFPSTWPGSTTVVMDRNYRSGIEIIETANKVIANMPPDTIIARSMKCERQTRAHVACHLFTDEAVEAAAIAQNIRRHFDQGLPWKDQAIVIRMNAMALAIEVGLATAAIPYRIVSGESFFKLTEAAVMLGYLRVATGRATLEDVEVSLVNPNRMLGKVYFEQLAAAKVAKPDEPWASLVLMPQLGRKQYEEVENWVSLISELHGQVKHQMTPYQALTYLVKEISLADWLRDGDDGDNSSSTNISQVMAFAANYDTVDGLLSAVDKVLDNKKSASRLRNVVEVSTIHRYKGREASVVYMPSVVQGLFPSSLADLLEERRLFYVGVTRAMDELWVSCSEYKSDDTSNTPSMFLAEAGLRLEPGSTYMPGRKIQPVKVGTQMGLLL